ncbi:leucine-rich repeat-containing protein 43 [Ascaphus truei]|uniref:leucine-rich repeat-containing protein 43 n=1 Tax=Ascaphus truei TaxID=8439 RepID=UPI003F5A5396
MSHVAVSAVFKEQLASLCLGSFPCGSGSWNKSRLKSRKTASSDTYWESDDPEEESLDALKGLLRCELSPWALEDSWSSEAQHLRDLAVKCPELINDKFIFSYFKSLRVVDKEVNEVDENLLRFQNLEELVLSANKIRTLHSSSLPRKLKVLELCSNQISSLKDLSANPPPRLQHLGLSYNRICCSSENIYLTARFWPNLLSLDLSFNDLNDLFDLVPRLSTLQQLRILVLQGNPLTFTTAYRGYTIDLLPTLCVLDDAPILPDEKHQFSGLSRKQGVLENTAQFLVNIEKLQGVPDPIQALEQETLAEYPVVTYNYCVTYEFIEDQKSRELGDAQQPERQAGKGSYKTAGKPWCEVLECEYAQTHTLRDLRALKAFLLSGMAVTVTEEKTLHWPPDPIRIENVKSGKKKGGKKEEKKGKEKKEEKGGSSRGSKKGDSKNKKNDKNKKKKKKKENIDDLRHDPPIVKTLGSVHVPLDSFVSGEMAIRTVCNFGVLPTVTQPSTCDKESKKSNGKKGKGGRDSTDTSKTLGSTRGKGKQKVAEIPLPLPPPRQPIPLTVEIQVQLLHYKSASDALEK